MAARGWRVSAERPRIVVPRQLLLPPAPIEAEDVHIAALKQALDAAQSTSKSLATRIEELEEALEHAEEDAENAHRQLAAATVAARKHSVLIIHHDSGVRAMTKHSFEKSGYQVMTSSDGLEALHIAISEKPDVILADASFAQLFKGRDDVKIVLIGAGEDTATLKRAVENALSSVRS